VRVETDRQLQQAAARIALLEEQVKGLDVIPGLRRELEEAKAYGKDMEEKGKRLEVRLGNSCRKHAAFAVFLPQACV
jgi:hypothetical protein